MAHPTQLSAADTALLVIDVQEKLVPKILDADALQRNTAFLIDAARLLRMPVLATEQYPKGLGPTVACLRERLPERPDKVAFSCAAVPSARRQRVRFFVSEYILHELVDCGRLGKNSPVCSHGSTGCSEDRENGRFTSFSWPFCSGRSGR